MKWNWRVLGILKPVKISWPNSNQKLFISWKLNIAMLSGSGNPPFLSPVLLNIPCSLIWFRNVYKINSKSGKKLRNDDPKKETNIAKQWYFALLLIKPDCVTYFKHPLTLDTHVFKHFTLVYDQKQVSVSGTQTEVHFRYRNQTFFSETETSNLSHVSHFFRGYKFFKLENKPRSYKLI